MANHVVEKTEKDLFESPYYDYLQQPLQPLGDNLESRVYETFEKDPVKYAKYQKAILRACVDIHERDREQRIVLMVVGAGRGPLVR